MANDVTMAHRFPVNLPPANGDIAEAIVTVLYDLNLLPTKDDLDRAGDAGASFRGPPQSVAVIESGATALAKWWAVAGSGILGGLWLTVAAFWRNNTDIHGQMLWSAALVSAAIVLGVAYLLASDVRGRAAAMVETVTARKDVAKAIVDAVLRNKSAQQAEDGQVVPLAGLFAENLEGADSDGWHVIAMRNAPEGMDVKYLLVKGDVKKWVGAQHVRFS